MGAVVVPPGPYRLRFAATDAAGRGGTADYQLIAELVQAGPLKVSSIVMGLSRPNGFVPKLQFGAEPVAIAFLELYGVPEGAVPLASVELSKSVNGPALATVPGVVDQTSDPGRRIVRAAVPIGGLQPGDYAVRAIVGLQGQPQARVVSGIRKAGP
jgi:hypothetical protein